MRADYHMHTAFSDDSSYPMEDAVRRAIALGLDEICFTEHVDYGIKTDDNCDYPAYFREISRCREKYGRDISIKQGIEFGVQLHTIKQYQQDFANNLFDFVLLSCHQVDDREFWDQGYQRGRSQQEYNEAYYEEIRKVLEAGYLEYSVLAHLDVILRYDEQGHYPFAKVRDLVAAILEIAIASGKGMELNTSSDRYKIGDLTPARDTWRLYKDMGGEVITIGSDCHTEKHLGYGIDEGKAQLKALGFTRFCTFERMQPVFHDL